MSKYSNDGHKLNHQILSPCTKRLVVQNLESHHRVGCLKKVDVPFCGDGIVQEGEDCDCGTVLQCIGLYLGRFNEGLKRVGPSKDGLPRRGCPRGD